jgi:hypothetical protein
LSLPWKHNIFLRPSESQRAAASSQWDCQQMRRFPPP